MSFLNNRVIFLGSKRLTVIRILTVLAIVFYGFIPHQLLGLNMPNSKYAVGHDSVALSLEKLYRIVSVSSYSKHTNLKESKEKENLLIIRDAIDSYKLGKLNRAFSLAEKIKYEKFPEILAIKHFIIVFISIEFENRYKVSKYYNTARHELTPGYFERLNKLISLYDTNYNYDNFQVRENIRVWTFVNAVSLGGLSIVNGVAYFFYGIRSFPPF